MEKKMFDELLKCTIAHNKLKKNYIDCLDNDNFKGFSNHFKYYIEKTNLGEENVDVRKVNQRVAAIKEFAGIIINCRNIQDKIIDYFKRANLVSPENMLMSFWTSPENERYFRYNKDHNEFNNKHIDFWNEGVKITKKHYDLYCEVFNKSEFMKPKEEFFSQQSIYFLNQKLHHNLVDKPNQSLKMKI